MIQTVPESFVTRPPRILLDENQCARVSLWRDGEEEAGEFPAEMIDISSGGTKLRVTTCLRFEESVRLRIEIPSVDLNCYVLASVRHIRQAGEGCWIVGCAVYPPLDEKAVARLAMQEGCDRRRWQREPIALPVSVRRQLAMVDSQATMVNLSTGGFCLQLGEPCTAGECIRVGVPDASGSEYTVMARAQWQLKTPEGFLVGCKFMRADDYEVIQAVTGGPDEKSKAPKEEYSLWPAAALLACAPIAMVVLLETNWEGPVAPPPPVVQEAAAELPAPVTRDETDDEIVRDVPAGEAPNATAPGKDEEPAEAPSPQVAGPEHNASLAELPDAPPAAAALQTSEATAAPGPAPTPTPELREWVDRTGQFRVVAVFLTVDSDQRVHLRRVDGREVVVPIDKLSALDVEYVRQLTGIGQSASEWAG